MSANAEDSANYQVFRDCLLADVLAKLAGPSGPKEPKRKTSRRSSPPQIPLDSKGQREDASQNEAASADDALALTDFAGYLAEEIFSSLPEDLQRLSYRTMQNDAVVGDRYTEPLSGFILDELVSCVPPSTNDSLIAYGLVSPPSSDLHSFMSHVFHSYVAAVTVPPPKWAETRTSSCQICHRDWIPLTYHHLIPRQVHDKVLKRGWHSPEMLNSVAWLCRACHSFVHRMASNEALAREWYNIEKINSREDVQKWALWVGRVRWKKS